MWWLLPWLTFHALLSSLTLVHHTAPHIPFLPPGLQYDEGRAVVSGTVTLKLPGWASWLLQNVNYHLPQHIDPGIPLYHLPRAYGILRERLEPYVTECEPNAQLVHNFIHKWQVYDEQQHVYITFSEAMQRAISRQYPGSQAASASSAQQQQQQQQGESDQGTAGQQQRSWFRFPKWGRNSSGSAGGDSSGSGSGLTSSAAT